MSDGAGDGHKPAVDEDNSDKEEVTVHEGGSIHKNDYSLDQFASDVEVCFWNSSKLFEKFLVFCTSRLLS